MEQALGRSQRDDFSSYRHVDDDFSAVV